MVEGYRWKDGSKEEPFKWDHLMESLQGMDSDENQFAVEINRDVNDGRSFSPEAIESLARTCMTFVLARCDNYWKREHEPPSKLKLLFSLGLDHERPDDKLSESLREGDGPMDK